MNLDAFKRNYSFNYLKENLVDCQCYSDKCIIKKINIFDFTTGVFKEYKICTEFLRQFFDNVELEKYGYTSFYETWENKKYLYESLVCDIAENYYKDVYGIIIDRGCLTHSKSLNSVTVYFEISYRPFIRYGISLQTCFELILKNDNWHTTREISKSVIDCLEYFFSRNNYKYNVTLQKEVFAQIKRLNNYSFKETNEMQILEIISNLYKITIKNN